MRKALIPAFLLVVAAIVLGSTVFREQVVNAATTPFQNVVVQNTSTNPIPVKQVGTSTTSVTGTVGIDEQEHGQARIDGNTVNLDSTDSGHLANIESDLGNLKFDSSGNLETTARPAHREPCHSNAHQRRSHHRHLRRPARLRSAPNDFYVTDITASRMDDDMRSTSCTKATRCSSSPGAASAAPTRTSSTHASDPRRRDRRELQQRQHYCDFSLGGARQLDRQLTS